MHKLASKYGRELYDEEIRRKPDSYTTPRSKERLLEYYIVEDGYDKARKTRPDLAKAEKASEKAWGSYCEECKKVSDSILGSYGNTKLYECEYYSYTIRDTVGDAVLSMDKDWRFKN